MVIELLVWLLICCVLIELLCGYWTNKKENQENERKMCLMFFSMRWHYTTTFRCVVIFGFFQRGLSLWFLDNLYYYIFFVFLFFLKTGRKRMMTMFWSGEKARKKSLETKSQKVPKIQNNHFKYIVTRTKNTISWIQIK